VEAAVVEGVEVEPKLIHLPPFSQRIYPYFGKLVILVFKSAILCLASATIIAVIRTGTHTIVVDKRKETTDA
jgi:hypothetical protein